MERDGDAAIYLNAPKGYRYRVRASSPATAITSAPPVLELLQVPLRPRGDTLAGAEIEAKCRDPALATSTRIASRSCSASPAVRSSPARMRSLDGAEGRDRGGGGAARCRPARVRGRERASRAGRPDVDSVRSAEGREGRDRVGGRGRPRSQRRRVEHVRDGMAATIRTPPAVPGDRPRRLVRSWRRLARRSRRRRRRSWIGSRPPWP